GPALLKEAVEQLKIIRENEAGREDPVYSGGPDSLDDTHALPVCLWPSSSPIEQVPDKHSDWYKMDRPRYGKQLPCEWIAIIARAENIDHEPIGGSQDNYQNWIPTLQLHVWGGGLEQRVQPLQYPDMPMKVYLTSKPEKTQLIYFAQLEDANGKPLSEVQPIETSDQCARNQIRLTFRQVHPSPPSPSPPSSAAGKAVLRQRRTPR